MILFNVISCICCLLGISAVALILEGQLRTAHRLSLCVMAATMVMSTWAVVAGISGTDGWVFVGFRTGLMVHLFCEYTPRLRDELVQVLKRHDPAGQLPEPLRWLQPLADEPPPYLAGRPPEPRRPH